VSEVIKEEETEGNGVMIKLLKVGGKKGERGEETDQGN